jgi:hypothetical protein
MTVGAPMLLALSRLPLLAPRMQLVQLSARLTTPRAMKR